MNVSVVGKQFELTESIKDYIYNAFDSLNKTKNSKMGKYTNGLGGLF